MTTEIATIEQKHRVGFYGEGSDDVKVLLVRLAEATEALEEAEGRYEELLASVGGVSPA